MDAKGSITVFFTLILSLMIALLSTLLLSAKVAAGRTQIALAVDQTMFSALAKYDRTLFEEYHLLYMDGGYGLETLQLGKALDEMEEDLSYLLMPNKGKMGLAGKNLLQLTCQNGEITGYTLATDNKGSVFKEQVVAYMKDTLGIQGISLLTQELSQQMETIESQGNLMEQVKRQGTLEDYEQIKIDAADLQKKKEEERNAIREDAQTEIPDPVQGTPAESISQETKQIAEQTRATLDTVTLQQKTGLLHMVLPDEYQISGWTADEQELLSKRSLQSGMGLIMTHSDQSVMEQVLFQEYVMKNINHYQKEQHREGPRYGVEWMLFHKISDRENLEAMVNRLLLIREAVNTAGLCMDSAKMQEIHMLADSLALLLEMPFVKPIIEGAIILAWSYAESLVDLHALMAGKDVPLIKDAAAWQVSFGEIPGALADPGNYYAETAGISYETYLRIFLMMQSQEKQVEGAMEVIELSMRELPGKEGFSFDCAVDTLEARFEVQSEQLVTFYITRSRSYRRE